MSPLQISILLHYHCSASDFRDGDFTAPAVREEINEFKESGFLRLSTAEDHQMTLLYPTDKTTAYVKALCAMPEPVLTWVVPASAKP